METKRKSPEELTRMREEVSTASAPRAAPTYDSISETKATRFGSEPKPTLRREIVKR